MYLILTIFSGLAAAYFYVPDFLDIPLGMLTFRGIVGQLGFLGCAAIGLAGLAKSVEKDPVWPWNRRFRLFLSRFRAFFY
jgi:hypothetical protein